MWGRGNEMQKCAEVGKTTPASRISTHRVTWWKVHRRSRSQGKVGLCNHEFFRPFWEWWWIAKLLEQAMNNKPTYWTRNSLMEKGKRKKKLLKEKNDSDLRETMDLIFPLEKSRITTSVYAWWAGLLTNSSLGNRPCALPVTPLVLSPIRIRSSKPGEMMSQHSEDISFPDSAKRM